jgi:hypothetical protein
MLVGAVIYDPKVSVIWDIIARFFTAQGCAMDAVSIPTTACRWTRCSPVTSTSRGTRRWRGWTLSALGRHVPRDRRCATPIAIAARTCWCAPMAAATVGGPARARVAVGASDSPQATLLPIHHSRPSGLSEPTDRLLRHDVLVGKHGDHVGGERDALDAAHGRQADAAAVLDLNWELWSSDGTVDPARVRVLEPPPIRSTTATSRRSRRRSMRSRGALDRVLLSMDYANPATAR